MAIHLRWRSAGLVLAAVLTAGCSGSAEPAGPGPGAQAVPMMSLPEGLATACRSAAGGALPCPRLVPETRGPQRSEIFEPRAGHLVFFAEWSGPYPGITPKNSPPRFVHLVVQRGALDAMLEFPLPAGGAAAAVTGEPSRQRREALLMGRPRWGGRQGRLVLAPPFPRGGIEGDHLMFVWKQDGQDHTVSLHAWLPLREVTAALRKVVESIP
jgi:hypothetical protein